jgi:cytochrome c-type biogenesis protein CcmH
MTLWIVLTVMVAIVAAVLTVPLVRRHEARADARAATLAVLKDQLGDIDGQLAAGTLQPGDADSLRLEIKRRMLAAGHIAEDAPRPFAARALGGVAIGLAAMVALAAAAMYAGMGNPTMGGNAAPARPAAPQAPAGAPNDAQATAEIAQLITGLETKVAQKPDDPQGWQLLGWAYFQTGRYADAASAYGKAVALRPDGAGYQSAWGEALVQAGNGTVSPVAAAAFAKAKAQDPNDARARYFLGLAKQQTGDVKGALDDWFALLAESPADAPWVPQLRGVIGEAAQAAGIDVSARLAAIQPPASGGAAVAVPGLPTGTPTPGPTAEQMASAQQMAPADQQAMVRGMVDRLAGKLATNPKDEDGWLRLMRARMVLGEGAEAAKARDAALKAFAGDAAAQGRIRAAATELGLPG